MIVSSSAADIVYTPYFSGVHGNYLKPSIAAAGLDPDNLPASDPAKMSFDKREERPKAWKDVWGAGQGVGSIDDIPPAREVVARLCAEYEAAKQALSEG
jgi:nitronate monooxygenase